MERKDNTGAVRSQEELDKIQKVRESLAAKIRQWDLDHDLVEPGPAMPPLKMLDEEEF